MSDTLRVELEKSVEVLRFQQVRNSFEVDSGIAHTQRTEIGNRHNRFAVGAQCINGEITVQGHGQEVPQGGSFKNSFPPLQQLRRYAAGGGTSVKQVPQEAPGLLWFVDHEPRIGNRACFGTVQNRKNLCKRINVARGGAEILR